MREGRDKETLSRIRGERLREKGERERERKRERERARERE